MINSGELRQGNIINYCTHPVTVKGTTEKSILFEDENGKFQREINNHNFTYHQLSTKILEDRCGFEKHTDSVWNDKKKKFRIIEENGQLVLCSWIKISDGHYFSYAIIKYVHQLQNLYYYLSLTELEFELKRNNG
jgi:hypothetical protein